MIDYTYPYCILVISTWVLYLHKEPFMVKTAVENTRKALAWWSESTHSIWYFMQIRSLGAFVFSTAEIMNSFLCLPVITHETFNLLTSEQYIMHSLKYFLPSQWIESVLMTTLMLHSLTYLPLVFNSCSDLGGRIGLCSDWGRLHYNQRL